MSTKTDWSKLTKHPFDACLFDMDGTLMDSERLSAVVVHDWLREANVESADFEMSTVEGLTWAETEAAIMRRFPSVADRPIATELISAFDEALRRHQVQAIPKAIDSVRDATRQARVGLVTSSRRSSVQIFLQTFNVTTCFDTIVAAEDVTAHKPDPMPYLLAARHLGVSPANCLVFEDSPPGIAAAANARMTVIQVGAQHKRMPSASGHIADFRELPSGFFEQFTANPRSTSRS